MLDSRYQQTIEEFSACLIQFEIPFSIQYFLGGAKWTFPFCDGDFICNKAINFNFVESKGMPWDDDEVTLLTISEALKKMLKHFPNC